MDQLTQNHLLDTVLASTKLTSAILDQEDDPIGLSTLAQIVANHALETSSSLTLSSRSIKTLIKLACTPKGEFATDLLTILVQNLPLLITRQAHELANQDDSLQPWYPLVSKTLCDDPVRSFFNKKLKVINGLAQRDPRTYATCVKWISNPTTHHVVDAGEGLYIVLLTCLKISALPNFERTFPREYAIRLTATDLVPYLHLTVSTLFDKEVNLDPLKCIAKRAARLVGSQVLGYIYSSGLQVNLDQFIAPFATSSDLLPAYAETLEILSRTGSIHAGAYVDRCLGWLVRRFAEDEEISVDTQQLTARLNAHLESSDAKLPAHLVNPVLSAAIARWLPSDSAIRLADLLVRHTLISDTDALKHTRTIVESRQFKTLMTDDSPGSTQSTTVMSLLASMITAFPTISAKVDLSASLIAYYGATLSAKDRLILRVFRIEDLCTQDNQFNHVLSNWKLAGQTVTSGPAFIELIPLLDSSKMFSTCVKCLDSKALESFEGSESFYDPYFILVYLFHVIDQGPISMSCWNSIAQANMLGLAMCALSSSSKTWRMLGDRCLAKAYGLLKVYFCISSDLHCCQADLVIFTTQIQTITHTEATELLLPLEHFRSLHPAQAPPEMFDSVPPLITLFLTQCLHIFAARPESSLHPRLTRFLMQRSMVDVADVPMLYTMLYSDGDRPIEDQKWLLEMLRDGLRSTRVGLHCQKVLGLS